MSLARAMSRRRMRLKAEVPEAYVKIDPPHSAEHDASAEKLITVHYLRERDKSTGKNRRSVGVHPSQLTSCLRKQQFELLNAPHADTRTSPVLLRIWDNGHSSEWRLARALTRGAQACGATFTPKIRVRDDSVMIDGELDGILKMRDGSLWIVDFKTINREWFAKLEAVSESYEWQFLAYMYVTGIHQTICYYECKDNQIPKEFLLRFNAKRWKKIVRTVIRPIFEATRNGELLPIATKKPKNAEHDRHWCVPDQCSYKALCFSQPDFDEVDHRTPSQKRRLPQVV